MFPGTSIKKTRGTILVNELIKRSVSFGLPLLTLSTSVKKEMKKVKIPFLLVLEIYKTIN